MLKSIHVAVGVIVSEDKVLISLRGSGQHLAGLWEFPGGKVEPGELGGEALVRELQEELAIRVSSSVFLFDLDYQYPEKTVKLSIYLVDDFIGDPRGVEGQPIKWCPVDELSMFTFPPANQPILDYLKKEFA